MAYEEYNEHNITITITITSLFEKRDIEEAVYTDTADVVVVLFQI